MLDNKIKNDIMKKISQELKDVPQELPVNLIVVGESARKLHYVKTIISNTHPELSEEDVLKYILWSGVEREIDKINTILNNE